MHASLAQSLLALLSSQLYGVVGCARPSSAPFRRRRRCPPARVIIFSFLFFLETLPFFPFPTREEKRREHSAPEPSGGADEDARVGGEGVRAYFFLPPRPRPLCFRRVLLVAPWGCPGFSSANATSSSAWSASVFRSPCPRRCGVGSSTAGVVKRVRRGLVRPLLRPQAVLTRVLLLIFARCGEYSIPCL